jgi:hypothetical protein
MGAIVWLASYPKSGNTWARNFLHNLLRPRDDTYDINEMNELTTGAAGRRWYQPFLARPLAQCSLDEVAAVRPKAQAMLAGAADGLVFVKSHGAVVADLGWLSINRDVTAGAIYIVRNPLDVAPSYANHVGQTIDRAIEMMNQDGLRTANNDDQAYEPIGSWSQHVESWTRQAHQALHVMRYEDMLGTPEETFGRLCRFLRIAATPEELRAALDKSSFARLREQEERRGFAERPDAAARFFREGRAGAWRETLTPAQVERIVVRHRTQMARFLYLPAG